MFTQIPTLFVFVIRCEHLSKPNLSSPMDKHTDAELHSILSALYRHLLQPFESVLLGVSTKKLAIVPHGKLWYAPFAALPGRLSQGRCAAGMAVMGVHKVHPIGGVYESGERRF